MPAASFAVLVGSAAGSTLEDRRRTLREGAGACRRVSGMASWSEVISSVQQNHAQIEQRRRTVEARAANLSTAHAEAHDTLNALRAQAASLRRTLASSTAEAESAADRIVQRRQRSEGMRAAALADDLLAARVRNQSLSQQIASSAHTAQKQIPRVWGKATGAMLSMTSTLASTNHRVGELQSECALLVQTSESLAKQMQQLQQEIQTTSVAGKQAKLAQVRAALAQAQSASAGLVERLAAQEPDTYVASLSAEHERRSTVNRELQNCIATVRRETGLMERRISSLAGA
eukprot:COSAG06_NODE_13084_length_1295_cov_0.964047_1_plen_289_part_00